MANGISILEETKKYVVVRMPKKLARNFIQGQTQKKEFTEADVRKLVKKATAEYRAGRAKTLRSLRDLR